MDRKLSLQRFIDQHSDWEKILSEKPYCLNISRDEVNGHKLLMFKYNQIDSDFNVELVRECRGLILDEETLEPVCIPFFKFGNYGESYCPEIDWSECWCGQKIDGSLIKVVKMDDGKLLISTNGTIDAFKAPIAEQIGCKVSSFGGLVDFALAAARKKSCENKAQLDWVISDQQWLSQMLETGYTYMFELTSPFNKVVVSWHEVKLWYLGKRNNKTLEETYFTEDKVLNSIFDVPKVYPLRNVEECVKAAQALGVDEEGYVICDSNFNRIKIKSPTYVSLHHMKNNGVLSYERGIEIVRGNELAEVLTYFPEFAEHLNAIKSKYDEMIKDLNSLEDRLNGWLQENGYDKEHWLVESGGKNRKDLAAWAFKNTKLTGFLFALVDHRIASAAEWLEKTPSRNLCKLLGLKEPTGVV